MPRMAHVTRPLIQALASAAEHDGIDSVAQAELPRAVGDSLYCPLPPLLRNASLEKCTRLSVDLVTLPQRVALLDSFT